MAQTASDQRTGRVVQVIGPVRDEASGEVTVTVTGNALTLVPGYTWEIQQTAHGTIERFTTP